MQVHNADGTVSTNDESRRLQHTVWPCPVPGHFGKSCQEAIAEWATAHGKQVDIEQPGDRPSVRQRLRLNPWDQGQEDGQDDPVPGGSG